MSIMVASGLMAFIIKYPCEYAIDPLNQGKSLGAHNPAVRRWCDGKQQIRVRFLVVYFKLCAFQ
jgi:hypothetical protein